MSFLRVAPRLRTGILQTPRIQTTSFVQTRFASGDYGSGTGDPKGEKPQEQGPNPSEKLEHPGPPPPKTSDKTNKPQGGQSGSGEKKG